MDKKTIVTFILNLLNKFSILSCTFLALALSISTTGHGQAINVNISSLDSYFRRAQLSGEIDSAISFTIRPLNLNIIDSSGKSLADFLIRTTNTVYSTSEQKFKFNILPVFWQQQYIGSPLQTRNDGPMIQTKGYQTMLSAGVGAKLGALHIQFRPEYVFAKNQIYETRKLYDGNADLPQQFGLGSYHHLSWGQSSVGLDIDPFTLSLSTENLWWGPGLANSLLMSNSAPGFKHVSLKTGQPVKTPIGSFEAQLIAGRLDGSGLDTSLPDDWRYFSGLVFSFQPKWVPGLFFGLTRSFQIYSKDMDNSFGDIFPIFQAFQKFKTNEDSKRRDQVTSIYSRLLLPSVGTELYFEYGLNDHSYNTRDFLMAPEHSRAYLLGFKKLMPFKQRKREFLEFIAEITHLEQSIDYKIRSAGEWYTHYQVLHGYTNRGQILGAGIGPSGNSLLGGINWVRDFNLIGVQFERYEHNGDMARLFEYSPWIDFSISTVAERTFDKFLMSGKIQAVNAINYQWKDGLDGRPKKNLVSVNVQLGIMYSF